MAKVIDPGDADDQMVGGVTDDDLRAEMEAINGPKVPSQRGIAAAKLKLRGASYVDIAQVMEFANSQAARSAVESTLAQMQPGESFESLRQIASARLDAMLMAVSPEALSPWIEVDVLDKEKAPRYAPNGKKMTKRVRNESFLGAQKMMLAIVDRQIRLHGIDAPTVSVIRTPQADEFEATIRAMLGQAADTAAQEGDVLQLDEDENGIWAESGPIEDEERS